MIDEKYILTYYTESDRGRTLSDDRNEVVKTLLVLWKIARSAQKYYTFPVSHSRLELKEALKALDEKEDA